MSTPSRMRLRYSGLPKKAGHATAPSRRLAALAEELRCPRCGEKVTVERLDAQPITWQEATYRVSCAAGDYGLIISGRDISDLQGVALKAA